MKANMIILIVSVFLFNDLSGQIGRLPLSPVQKLEQQIGITDISIVYSRPSMRGRVIFGDLVPYNKLWRTGANRNTTIEFSKDVSINNKKIKKGKYAIFTIPSPNQWKFLLYADTDNWDVPEEIDSSKIAVSVLVNSTKLAQKAEVFTVSVGDFTNYAFDLNIYWDDTSISVPIDLTTKEIMDAKIERIMNGPSYNDYYAAAVYEMESGKDLEKGLSWINKAIETNDEVSFWDLRVKAILLMESGDAEQSIKIAKEGLVLAEKAKRAYGINEFTRILKQTKK